MSNSASVLDPALLRKNPDWRKVISHFELAGLPAPGLGGYLILLVPDSTTAEACRHELSAFLQRSSAKLYNAVDGTPESLAGIAGALRQYEPEPGTAAVWVEGVAGEWQESYESWRAAWERAAVGLNRSRDTLVRQLQLPIILVGAPWLLDTLSRVAPDLWSLRTLVAHVAPVISEVSEQRSAAPAPQMEASYGDPEFALQQAEKFRGQPGKEHVLAELLDRAASGFLARGEWLRALPLSEEAVRTYAALDTSSAEILRSMARALNGHGLITYWTGKLDDAMAFYKQSEEILARLGDRAGLGASYCNQALILMRLGHLDEATDLLKRQAVICDDLGDRAGLAVCYGNQALILKARGQLDEAMALLKKQQAICKQLGDRSGLQASYGNQALILKAWGRLDEAMALLKKQQAICEELGDRAGLARSYGNQAAIHGLRNEPGKRRELLTRALEIFTEIGMVRERDQTKRLLDEV